MYINAMYINGINQEAGTCIFLFHAFKNKVEMEIKIYSVEEIYPTLKNIIYFVKDIFPGIYF